MEKVRKIVNSAKLGVGTYRLKAKKQDAATLYQSLLHGVRVIDTAAHYANGEAEGTVGFVLNALLGSGRGFARDDFLVVTKFGFIEDEEYSSCGGFPQSFRVSENLWGCFHPQYLEYALKRSSQRLGGMPDYVLLHNPEFFFANALQRGATEKPEEEFYQRVEEAFCFLEEKCGQGLLKGYGVSTNTESCKYSVTGYSNDHRSWFESTNLQSLINCAANAAGRVHGSSQDTGFTCLQLPFNVFETGGLEDFRQAQKHGIMTMGNRPLNCIAPAGFGRGDWGRNDSHFKLRQGSPASPEQALLNRLLTDSFQKADIPQIHSLAQKGLLFASSPSCIDLTLSGPTRLEHVADIATIVELNREVPQHAIDDISEVVSALLKELRS